MMIEHWIIPCNVNFFDVIEHFTTNKFVVWNVPYSIKVDDEVYLYIGKPYGEIKYKCIVVEDNIDKETINLNQYAIPKRKISMAFSRRTKYIKMQLVHEYDEGELSLSKLRECGLGQVQVPARTSFMVQELLDEK